MSDDSRDSRVRGKEILTKPVASSAPTPTIVRPGSLPLHMSNDPLHPTLPSPTSVITQAPPSNRQLGSPTGSYPLVRHLPNGQTVPLLPSPVQMTSVISLARPVNSVPNIPGIPGPPIGGASSGSSSPSGYSLHSETKMGPGAQDGAGGGAGSIPAVPQRQEQSQQPTQNSDAPSPAQPQVSPAQPTGGRRRRATEMDPDERRQRFLERNRAAASRCRQKRKIWVNSLEKKADDLANMNVSLTNEVTLLRNEVAQLKQLLLAHKDCPVTVMQKKAAFLGWMFLSLSLAAGGEETSRDTSTEPIGSPAAVIQHGPSPPASASSPGATINGLSVRAAEAVAMSVLAGMGSGHPGGIVMTSQSQSAPRWCADAGGQYELEWHLEAGLVQSIWKEGPALNPRLRYSPPLTANDNHTKTRHSASVNPPVPAGSLFRKLRHSLYVNMNNTSDTHSAGFGVISCSGMAVGKGFRLGWKVFLWKFVFISLEMHLQSNFVPHTGCDEVGCFTGW